MNNKLLSPIVIIALVFVGLGFIIVAAVVSLTKGKSAFWVDKKLKIGGVVLTLTSLISCGGNRGVVTCYDTTATNVQVNDTTERTTVDGKDKSQKQDNDNEPEVQLLCYDVAILPPPIFENSTIEISNDHLLVGYVPQYYDREYVYEIKIGDETIQKGNLKNDLSNGCFKIKLNAKVKSGTYDFLIYEGTDYTVLKYSQEITINRK